MPLPALLAPLVGGLLAGLAGSIGTLVLRVLVSLGIGYVTYQGIDTSIGWARSYIFSAMGSAPGPVMQVMGVMKVGSMVSIVLSGLVVRASLAGLIGGVKKMVLK